VLGFYRRRARERGVLGGRCGSVTFIQRFGSAANLNLHAHAIVLDGVFTEAPNGALRFAPAEPPNDEDIAKLLATIRTRIIRHLERHGLLQDDQADPFSDEAPLLASCYATSIAHRQTLGKRPGTRLLRLGDLGAMRIEHRAPWSDGTHPCHLRTARPDRQAGRSRSSPAQEPHPVSRRTRRQCSMA
jgi:Putative transposase